MAVKWNATKHGILSDALVIPEWEDRFGCSFFPRFATRSGFD